MDSNFIYKLMCMNYKKSNNFSYKYQNTEKQ